MLDMGMMAGLAGLGIGGNLLGGLMQQGSDSRARSAYTQRYDDTIARTLMALYGSDALGLPSGQLSDDDPRAKFFARNGWPFGGVPQTQGALPGLAAASRGAEIQGHGLLGYLDSETARMVGEGRSNRAGILGQYDTATRDLDRQAQDIIRQVRGTGRSSLRLIDQDFDRAAKESAQSISARAIGRGFANSTVPMAQTSLARGELERGRARAKDQAIQGGNVLTSGAMGQRLALGQTRAQGRTGLDASLLDQILAMQQGRSGQRLGQWNTNMDRLLQLQTQQATLPIGVMAGTPQPSYIPQNNYLGSALAQTGGASLGLLGNYLGNYWDQAFGGGRRT